MLIPSHWDPVTSGLVKGVYSGVDYRWGVASVRSARMFSEDSSGAPSNAVSVCRNQD